MKNKLTVLGALTIILLVFLAISFFPTTVNSAQNSTPAFVTSRFMLFSGTYQVDSDLQQSSLSTEHGVFKIDTYTGNVWIMKVTESPKKERIEQWRLIESSPAK